MGTGTGGYGGTQAASSGFTGGGLTPTSASGLGTGTGMGMGPTSGHFPDQTPGQAPTFGTGTGTGMQQQMLPQQMLPQQQLAASGLSQPIGQSTASTTAVAQSAAATSYSGAGQGGGIGVSAFPTTAIQEPQAALGTSSGIPQAGTGGWGGQQQTFTETPLQQQMLQQQAFPSQPQQQGFAGQGLGQQTSGYETGYGQGQGYGQGYGGQAVSGAGTSGGLPMMSPAMGSGKYGTTGTGTGTGSGSGIGQMLHPGSRPLPTLQSQQVV